ncbi:claspin [Venturia canescens]|uniref:claspin n=1 Tax=Venturia canescens TaxID=32260 RepID=UPI001C9C60F7|nr:claspin-like [Venturia canescens]
MLSTMESNATGLCENSTATVGLGDEETTENFATSNPAKNTLSNEDQNTKFSEDQNSHLDDVNLKTRVKENTEEEDEHNIVDDNIGDRRKKKYKTFLDSDSEEEENPTLSSFEKLGFESKLEDSSLVNDNSVSVKPDFATKIQNSRKFVESDSDEDGILDRTNVNVNNENKSEDLDQNTTAKSSKLKFCTIIDSDSADADDPDQSDSIQVESHNEATFRNRNKSEPKLNSILDSESEYDNSLHRTSPTVKKKKIHRKKKTKDGKSKQTSKSINLVDTDSEEDTQHQDTKESFNEETENLVPGKESGKKAKKRSGSVRAAKDEAMRQIHSETQRLIRNSAISLPYHVPKQRTLQDFLNRKKVIPLPEGLTTALKVKMSSEIVSKALEEKEKEAEAFFKSSDSEEEITCTPLSSNLLNETPGSNDQPPIEETQNIFKNDLQNAHNKKEIIQQAGTEIGVPRKLFIDEPLERDISVESKEDDNEYSVKLDLPKKTKETKQGIREGNVPRKLFPRDYDEGVDSPPKDAMIVSECATNSERRLNIEVDQENVDEGIHSLEKNNESSDDFNENDTVLKITGSEIPQIWEKEKINEKNDADPSNDLFNISETPIISNKEYAKLNEREISSKVRENSTDNSEITKDPTKSVFGDVIGLPLPDFDEVSSGSKTLDTKKKILSTLSKIQPKLRGSPGMMIDLTNDAKPDKEGIQSLRDRFFRHSTINKPKEVQSSVSVMRTEQTPHGLKVVEEILPYKIPVGGFTEKELQKPGAKYKRLKMDLIQKMAMKRDKEWELEAQRREENRAEEENEDEEKSEKEEEEVIELDEEEGTTESEPEVDDMPAEKRKKRKLREFADEEAEVSLEEDEEDEEDIDDEEDNISLRVDNDEDTQENCSDSESLKQPRRTRIVKPFDDDSNSQPDRLSETDSGGKILERTKTDVDMFASERDDWSSDNEAEFPLSQILPRDQADARSQLCKTPLTAVNALRFVSPITQLTGLNTSYNSPKESPADISFGSSRISGSFSEKTPIGLKESPISCDKDKRSNLQKKLFEDPTSVVNDDELMGLCSGKFTGLENETKDSIDPMGISTSEKVTETQLLGLCSGTFTSQILDLDGDEDGKNINEDSQDIRLTMDPDSEDSGDDVASKEITKSKYSSLRVKSSSEDDNSEDENASKSMKKRKVQQLNLSDDEEFSDEEKDEEEVSKNDEKYVDYDSEENEIVVVPKKDIKKVAATFLEAEAELSESEWGSEDEDEKGLDRLEFEEADEEEIDENQMRDQLEKIHMRRVHDDDQREVRMLQELLFDDGDLHTDGSGRERKFKWKNIDKLGDDDKFGPPGEDGGENGDMVEDETDLAWLNEKIEREKFLEGTTKTDVDEVIEELAADSQVFTLGMKALKRTKSSQNSQKEQSEPVIMKPVASRTILDLVDTQSFGSSRTIIRKAVSRGSFLARGDECLARMAVHLKETETTVIKKANPRNFVFGQMNPSDEEPTKMNENNRTGDISLDTLKGNKRKSTGSLTPRSTKKAKIERAGSTRKK